MASSLRNPASLTQPQLSQMTLHITDVTLTSYGPVKNKIRLEITDISLPSKGNANHKFHDFKPIMFESQLKWKLNILLPVKGSELVFQIFELSVLGTSHLKVKFPISVGDILRQCLQNPDSTDLVLNLFVRESRPDAKLEIGIQTDSLRDLFGSLVLAESASERLRVIRDEVNDLMKKGPRSELHNMGEEALIALDYAIKQSATWKVCPEKVFRLFDCIAEFAPHLHKIVDVQDNEVKIISKRVLWEIKAALTTIVIKIPKDTLGQYS
ncbi:hypothetical protein BDN72DRAFT_835940 [Pluteus cervinus]|uniref:Uncharacterized protein n=1 Tax=Pluteus cervinus TaxID=181527 RepID=A0ACD3B6N5_9AGAR|nr:hypothetical protein BDN72DRAFT_835940 [Pluteus cervinus]